MYVAEEKIPEGPLARPRGNFFYGRAAQRYSKICIP